MAVAAGSGRLPLVVALMAAILCLSDAWAAVEGRTSVGGTNVAPHWELALWIDKARCPCNGSGNHTVVLKLPIRVI
jgi:hypothetical protein